VWFYDPWKHTSAIGADADGNIYEKELDPEPYDDMPVTVESGHLWYAGDDFILHSEYIDDFRLEPRAVYSVVGSLLVDNVFGWVRPAPGGGIFVYTDPHTCVLLYPDGRTVPVPNAPVVERFYFGG
jgi:hypothetical protein